MTVTGPSASFLTIIAGGEWSAVVIRVPHSSDFIAPMIAEQLGGQSLDLVISGEVCVQRVSGKDSRDVGCTAEVQVCG